MNDQMGISGKWVNKHTNNIINVRDSIIDGDQMIIISDIGQIDMKDFSENYIQISDEDYTPSQSITGNGLVNIESLYNIDPTLMAQPIIENNKEIIKQPVVNQPIVEENNTTHNDNYNLIDKLFKKINFTPKVIINIESSNYPTDKLNMLKEIYDITNEDISNYIRLNYIYPEIINSAINDFVNNQRY